MKKLILLLSVITLTFSSCSSDDDSQDSIIGIWNYYQSFENDEEYELDTCEKQDEIIFNADGTFSTKGYYENEDDVCSLDYESTGTWVNLGDNIYEFTDDEDNYTSTATIIFSGNTFYFIDEDGSDTYKDVYIKN
ncbi:lipocalin family protein [Algibacter sp. L3A6]|uniref:lipocalin family protein n=1 Tax=Algibacter sp. L3A6 TaxID=2686366 RepID=UPI00131D3740|nr:lipocalin family protein [Algibacter sp. L3A6]